MRTAAPEKQGLYDPANEKDACGVGFVADIKGRRSHQIVLDADEVLRAMDHRGGCGCETNTGDGAGILTALPDEFLRIVAKADLGIDLPEAGRYGAGNVFLPQDEVERNHCKRFIEGVIAAQGQLCLGWRDVPVDPEGADIGPTALASMPFVAQLFVQAAEGLSREAFERKLFIIRKNVSNALRTDAKLRQAKLFYVCTLSTRTIVYKGMLTPAQVIPFYSDLADWRYTTHLAMVHSRFSTNTFPSWDRAHPMRFMSHNGEINTLRGNVNGMTNRQGLASSSLIGDAIRDTYPIAEPDCSDSGNFDNVLEFLLMGGRSLPHAIMMMVPEAWQAHESMDPVKKAFYEYHSCLMEPWDGPASIAFTDGQFIGAVLDRNGLRPSRYYVTHDDKVIMASEVGVLHVEPSNVKEKGRLQPGRIFLIDFAEGRMIPDSEVKQMIAGQKPYEAWLASHRVLLSDLATEAEAHGFHPETLMTRMQAFGYTTETLQFFLRQMVEEKRDPISSMGNDAALAVLSDEPRLVYDYFKQLFAQVTNPPIDSIREEIIMAVNCYIGPERNLLGETPEHAHRLHLEQPILSNEELAALSHINHRGWKAKSIDITWQRQKGAAGLYERLREIMEEAETAVDQGYSILVLSDRGITKDDVAISALLAVGAVHQHLSKQEKRTRVGIAIETGEAREVHHHCLLLGFGADAINPYLAFEALWQELRDGRLSSESFPNDDYLVKAYQKACSKGILKVMAKMGISTLQSYKGAQIFEAVGLNHAVVDLCFTNTASRIEGVGFEVLAEEALRRHDLGFPSRADATRLPLLPNDGQVHWRSDAEKHMWDPRSIELIQKAARGNDESAYWAL